MTTHRHSAKTASDNIYKYISCACPEAMMLEKQDLCPQSTQLVQFAQTHDTPSGAETLHTNSLYKVSRKHPPSSAGSDLKS